MDERRIQAALQAGPADEPPYEPLGWSGLRDGASARRSRPGSARAAARALAAAALLLLLLLVMPLLAGAPDRLRSVVSRGELRIVVSAGTPQVPISGRLVEGFDMDVAQAVAREVWPWLEVRTSVTAAEPAEIAAGGWADRWDLAFDSGLTTPARAAALELAAPYATRSGAVIVAAGSAATSLMDLQGRTLCVTAGGPGAAWVAGSLDLPGGATVPAPAGTVAIAEPDVARCLARVREGSADGLVADWELDMEPVPAGTRRLAEVPWTGLVAPAVARSGEAARSLLDAVDDWVGRLRDDGTLLELSRSRFGGRDLVTPPGAGTD